MNSAQLSDEPLISLIIPVYNTDKYLKQCLESALAQTYKNLEILIMAMSRNWVLMYLLYCVYCCSRFYRKDMMFE